MSRRSFTIYWALVCVLGLVLLSAACSDDDSANKDPEVTGDCNPLASEWDCLLPFPSDHYLVPDDTFPSGARVVIPDSAVPINHNDLPVNPMARHPADGFSRLPVILALFPFDVDDTNLVFHTDDVFESTGPDSPTVLMEADTGQRVLHFAELDPRPTDNERRALIIRPLVRLEERTRYIVAVRRLRTKSDEPVPPAPGFLRLRDATAASHPVLSQLEEHYELNLFPALAEADVDRAELQLAWDFTTGSVEHAQQAMLQMRSLAMADMEATPPAVTVTESIGPDVYDDGTIFRRVKGTIQVPRFVDSDEPGATITRDGDGNVVQNGYADVEFVVLIPTSVGEASPLAPAPVVQYGHGFFGSTGETEGGFVRRFANDHGFVVIGINWWGQETMDAVEVIANILDDTSKAADFTERTHQGLINQIGVTYALRGALADAPEMHRDGTRLFNPDELHYYGISQGGILGMTYVSLSPHVRKGVFGVGGCSLPFMMFRSSNFSEFLVVIQLAVEDYLDQQKTVAMLHTIFDRKDPITYVDHITDNIFPGGPASRQMLKQIGIADAQVPNLSSHLCARIIDLPLLTPANRSLPGITEAAGPLESALVEFDFGIPEPYPGLYATPPADGNEAHEGVRRTAAGQAQIEAFLAPGGMVENFCDGPCNPE